MVACVDDYSAEIVASGVLSDCLTVETETLRAYALVSPIGKIFGGISGFPIVWTATAGLGVLAAVGVALSVFTLKRSRK